jgi:hypothetical protein
MNIKTLTREQQKKLLSEVNKFLICDLEKGEFRWKKNRGSNAKQGSVAGYLNSADGYPVIELCKKKYSIHNLIWLVAYGKLPTYKLKHLNGNKKDNSISNLIENIYMPTFKKEKYRQVYFNKTTKKWKAQIKTGNQLITIGFFDTKQKAIAAYQKTNLNILSLFNGKNKDSESNKNNEDNVSLQPLPPFSKKKIYIFLFFIFSVVFYFIQTRKD